MPNHYRSDLERQSFTLKLFPDGTASDRLQLTGEIARRADRLHLHYELSGDLTELAIAPSAEVPERRSGLWEMTCFEFFVGEVGSPRYWEFNLSPAGHWQVFSFTNYREGRQAETAFDRLPFRVEVGSDRLTLDLECDLSAISPADCPLEIAVSSVIQNKLGQCSYWALVHPGEEADFHRRDSFCVQFPASSR